MESFWRHNQIDQKGNQNLDSISLPVLLQDDEQDFKIWENQTNDMNKIYQEAALQFSQRIIDEHGWQYYNQKYGNKNRLVTLVVNGKPRNAYLNSSLEGFGYPW